jgi:hypothetical protein
LIAFKLLLKFVRSDEIKGGICEKFEFPLPLDCKYNTYSWDYFDENYPRMSWSKVAQYICSIFARIQGTNDLLIKKRDSYLSFDNDKVYKIMSRKHVTIPAEKGEKKGKTKQILLNNFLTDYCYERLTYYEGISVISDNKNIFSLFRVHEPTNYVADEIADDIDFIRSTYKYAEDFEFDYSRDNWRFNNNFKRTNHAIGYYAKEGGEGKSYLCTLRCQIFDHYNTPAVSLSNLTKEQIQPFVENKLYIYFDEINKDNKVSGEATDALKRCSNLKGFIRKMREGEGEVYTTTSIMIYLQIIRISMDFFKMRPWRGECSQFTGVRRMVEQTMR